MAREKYGYREHYEVVLRRCEEMFPTSLGMLTTEQTATFLGCNVKTVIKNIQKRSNPLPAVNIGVGRTMYRVPIAGLVKWTVGG